jgi:hypothetical protein
MRARKSAVAGDGPAIDQALMRAVSELRPGATACPGILGEQVLRERGFEVDARDALLLVRQRLLALRAAGRVRFYQKGIVVPLGKAAPRGPFRVGR